jgi:hypothetical protein
VSDRVPDLDLGGHFALGPWRVRRAGYGAMQLAGGGGFGPPPDREAERSCRPPRSCPTRVWWCRSCCPCQYSERSVPGHQDDADIPRIPLDRTRPAWDLALDVDARLEGAAQMT